MTNIEWLLSTYKPNDNNNYLLNNHHHYYMRNNSQYGKLHATQSSAGGLHDNIRHRCYKPHIQTPAFHDFQGPRPDPGLSRLEKCDFKKQELSRIRFNPDRRQRS